MQTNLVTREDFHALRTELLAELRNHFDNGPAAIRPEYFRVKDACRFLQVSSVTLLKLRRAGLPSAKVNGIVYLRMQDIHTFMKSLQTNPTR